MHLVGLRLEVAEEALEAVPRVGPPFAGLAVFGVAVDDEVLLPRRELGERHVGRDPAFLREDIEVLFGLAVDFALPGLDGAGVEGKRAVGDGETVVDIDDAAEAAAFRARAQRGVEREQRGRGRPEPAPGLRRVQPPRVMADFLQAPAVGPAGGAGEEPDLPLAKMQRRFDRLEEPAPVLRCERNAVLRRRTGGSRV